MEAIPDELDFSSVGVRHVSHHLGWPLADAFHCWSKYNNDPAHERGSMLADYYPNVNTGRYVLKVGGGFGLDYGS